jgi:hypothetical protein
MNINKFLNIDIEPTPPELQLSVEVRCREIMASNDIDNIKRYATHLVRHQARQDVFLASLLGFLIDNEAEKIIGERKRKTNIINKIFRTRQSRN